MPDYVSPGDAFTTGLNNYYAKQQAAYLAAQEEQRKQLHDQLYMEQARAALEEKRRAFDEAQLDKRKSAFEKTVGEMMPGDIPSADLLADAKRFGVTHLFPEAQPTAPESLPGIAAPTGPAPEGIPTQEGITPTRTGAVANPEQQLGGVRFIGTRQEREKAAKDLKVQKIQEKLSKALPGSPEERSAMLEYEMETGKPIPAGFAKGSNDTAVFRVDPKRQVIQMSTPNGWIDHKGPVPQGAHWLQEPDTSARDAAAIARGEARDQRAEFHLDSLKKDALTELNKVAVPFEDQINNAKKMATTLAQGNNIADSVLAEQLLRLTAGGQGSGLRLNNVLVDRILHGTQSKWADIQLKLNAWKTDPTGPLVFQPQQKAYIAQLGNALLRHSSKLHEKIINARMDINDAKDSNTIRSTTTKAIQDVFAPDEDETTPSTPSIPKATVDKNGKVVYK